MGQPESPQVGLLGSSIVVAAERDDRHSDSLPSNLRHQVTASHAPALHHQLGNERKQRCNQHGRRSDAPCLVRECPPATPHCLADHRHAAGTIMELSICLQSTPRLSVTVADLAASSSVHRSQTGSVGFRCGQHWWSALRRGRRRANTWTAMPSGRGLDPLLTSAGSSESPTRTWGAASRHALACGKGSRQLSLFPAASRRHVPRMCPWKRLLGDHPACAMQARTRATRQAAVDIRVMRTYRQCGQFDGRRARRHLTRRGRLLPSAVGPVCCAVVLHASDLVRVNTGLNGDP